METRDLRTDRHGAREAAALTVALATASTRLTLPSGATISVPATMPSGRSCASRKVTTGRSSRTASTGALVRRARGGQSPVRHFSHADLGAGERPDRSEPHSRVQAAEPCQPSRDCPSCPSRSMPSCAWRRSSRSAPIIALHTGLWQADILRLPWSAYDGSAITLRQGKSARGGRLRRWSRSLHASAPAHAGWYGAQVAADPDDED